ncbi:MAG: ABC transporter permease [Syntrophobacteraceae bacterium]
MNAFFRLWIWFSLRQFRRHTWRTLAVLLGIGLGAAVFTSVRLATNASVQSFAGGVDAISGKADGTVVCPGGRVPEKIISTLLNAPEIRAASPLLTAYVRVEGDDEPLLLIGIDPILDRSFRSWKSIQPDEKSDSSRWRELISSPFTLLAGRHFLEKRGVRAGDSLRLQSTMGSESFRILGGLSSEGLGVLEGGNVAIADIATFQEFMGVIGQVDRIDLIFYPPVTEHKVKAVESLLPGGIFLEQPSETKATGQAMIRSYQMNLSVLSFVSLFVGMFLVYSLISLHATSRRKEIAILRSLGASSRTIFFLFIAEGSFFGLAGWVLSIPAGLLLTGELLGYISSTISYLFVRVHVEGIRLSGWEILLSFVVTLVVAILAASQPAYEASRVREREALLMRRAMEPEEGRLIGSLAILGLVLAALVWPLSRMPVFSGVPIPGYLATFFLFLGFALFSPFCLRTAGVYVPLLVRRAGLDETAYLGTRYLKSGGARVAISAGALITAIGLFAALVIMVHSFRDTVFAWVHQSINGDLYVRTKMSDLNRYRDPLPPEVVAELESLRGTLDLVPYRRIFLNHGDIPYLLEPIDTASFTRRSGFLLMAGGGEQSMQALDKGEGVLVSEVFSNQSGLRVGDRFHATVKGAELDLPILGVFRDFRTSGGVVHCSLSWFQNVTGNRAWTGASIFLRKGRRPTPKRH